MPSPIKKWLLIQPLSLPVLCLALAILTVDTTSPVALTLLICTGILAYLISRKILILSILTSLTGALLHHAQLTSQHKATLLDGEKIEILGIVHNIPKSNNNRNSEATIKVLQGPRIIENTKISAYIPHQNNLAIGQKIRLKGKVKIPDAPANPSIFNKKSFLHRKGIAIEINNSEIHTTKLTAPSYHLHSFAESARKWIRKKLTAGIEHSSSSDIILAMFLGEKPTTAGDIMTHFKHSGTIHVFAVSGLHVMMIGLIVAIALKLCRLPTHIWIPCVICSMFIYAIVTGMNPPAMRASIMGAIVLTGLLLLRKSSLPNCLWLSGIIALISDTHSLFLPGFQLSYTVLIAIAFTGNWWMKRYEWINYIDPFFPHSLLNKKQKSWLYIRKKTSETLAVSSSAWAGSSILIWTYFGIITPLAIIASLPLMLIVFIILITCCLSLTIGTLSPPAGKILNKCNAATATTAHLISKYIASIPNTRHQSKPWASGERIVIYHIPKGGAAAYLSLGGGILIDAGNKNQFYKEIWPSLNKNKARIDTLIASHPDINHVQGLTQALEKFPIKQLLIPPGKTRSTSHNKLIASAKAKETKIITPYKKTLPIADNIHLEILHTPPSHSPLSDDRCLVFMLHWHNKRILFLNDSGHNLEHWIRQNNHPPNKTKLNPHILVIGKHSTEESIHPEIIAQLNPKTIIATQSYFPPSQQRSQEWINAIKNQGKQLLLLNQSGAITITQTNQKLQLKTTLK